MNLRLPIIAVVTAAMAACTAVAPEVPIVPSEPAPQAGSPMVIHAVMDSGTKTSVVMNGAGTHADVVWNAGDQISLLSVLDNGSYYPGVFTTQDGGSTEADFKCDSWNPMSSQSKYLAFYPSERFAGYIKPNGSDAIGISIPVVQQAVKGGVERGLNLSVSYSGEKAGAPGTLHFKNILSLVHFRLDGSSASSVCRAELVTSYAVTGDGVYNLSPGGEGEINFNMYIPPRQNEPTASVQLTGTFEQGGDYYFALAPGVSNGFSLKFFDSNNDAIIKISEATINPRRSRILELGTITLDEPFGSSPAGVVKYMSQTTGSRPVDLMVLGDGFTASEQEAFLTRAADAIDKLFDTEPFKTYKDWFNVYFAPAVSNESGASVTDGAYNVTEAHDTYFKTAWGADSYNDMTADAAKVMTFVGNNCPEVIKGTLSANDINVLLLVNDSRYGGICMQDSQGAAIAIVPYTDNGGPMHWSFPNFTAVSDIDPTEGLRYTTNEEYEALGITNGDWRNVVLHEFGGHAFGRFADEYWNDAVYYSGPVAGQSWTVPTSLNVSASYDNVPWQADVLNRRDALVSKDARYQRTGVFQGGDTYPLGRWRSEMISCMIDNRPYYSTWQRVLIVKRLMQLAGESFDLDSFYALDNPTDPVRDGGSNAAPRAGQGMLQNNTPAGPVKFYPPLPPPVPMVD